MESQVWQLGKHQTKKKTSRLGTLTELKMISISCTVSMTKGKSSCMLDILTLQCGSIWCYWAAAVCKQTAIPGSNKQRLVPMWQCTIFFSENHTVLQVSPVKKCGRFGFTLPIPDAFTAFTCTISLPVHIWRGIEVYLCRTTPTCLRDNSSICRCLQCLVALRNLIKGCKVFSA